MASEINQLLYEYLQQLSPSHPDRRFLQGIQEAVAGYVDQTLDTGGTMPDTPAPVAQPIEPVAEPASVPTEAGSEPPRSAEQERIRVDGRLGRPPVFRTTSRGIRIARLVVAAHDEGDRTTWHTVLAFNKLADHLFTNRPAKGALVTVIDYRHPRNIVGRDGLPRTVE